jgi:hypothetical protein
MTDETHEQRLKRARAVMANESHEQKLKRAHLFVDHSLDLLAKSAEAAYRKGNRRMLAFILAGYFFRNRVPPKWARQEFIEGLLYAESWEAMLGKPLEKTYKRYEASQKAFHKGEELRKECGYTISDGGLFAALGEDLCTSTNTAKRHYYDIERQMTEERKKYARALGMTPGQSEHDDQVLDLVQLAGRFRKLAEHIDQTAKATSQKQPRKTRNKK